MTTQDPNSRNSILGGLLVLFLRGILLWIVVPIAACAWVFIAIRLRRRRFTFGQYLGWIDVNLIALLQRTICRPLVRALAPYVPPGKMDSVTHRLMIADPA